MATEPVGRVKAADPLLIEKEIATQLRLLREDANFRDDAASLGINLAEFDKIQAHHPLFEVISPKNHLSGVAESILINVAIGVGTKATIETLKIIWHKIIKPALAKGNRNVEDAQ